MRILLTARHPPNGDIPIGGVQSWCRTVAAELERLGHEVVFWGPRQKATGIFDLGIISNYDDSTPVMRLCKQHVVVCHGIIQPEKPPAKNAAFTSEELRDFWKGDGPIIRQPIDLDFWSPNESDREGLVRISYRKGLDFLPAVANAMGMSFRHAADASCETLRELSRKAACVVATGRSALEAMSCGAPVVICDDRPYQGPLLDPDVMGSMTRNYSGRGGVIPNAVLMIAAIERAMVRGSLRKHVEQHHDARQIVQELLCYTC